MSAEWWASLQAVPVDANTTAMGGKDLNMPEVEEFIRQWYYDEPSHEFARQIGAFLLQFLTDLESRGLSPWSLRQHRSNGLKTTYSAAGSLASSSVIIATTILVHQPFPAWPRALV